MSGKLHSPLTEKLLGNWKSMCTDMVEVIGLNHKPMLRSHYTEGFSFIGIRGEQMIKIASSYFPCFMDIIRNEHVGNNTVFLIYGLLMCSWYSLCFLFRSSSKVPANDKKERPLSTMSEVSNYTGSSDCPANSNSPAGRVRDTHEAGLSCMHVKEIIEKQLDHALMALKLCIKPH